MLNRDIYTLQMRGPLTRGRLKVPMSRILRSSAPGGWGGGGAPP